MNASSANLSKRAVPAQDWLNTQCRSIEDMACAALFLIDTQTGRFVPAAQYPVNIKKPTELIAIARIALNQGQPALKADIDKNDLTKQRFDYLALPVIFDSVLIGAVAVKMVHRPKNKQKEVAKRLQSAMARLVPAQPTKSTSSADFYAKVVQIVSRCLEQATFDETLNALVSHLASELNCERVSFGVVNKSFCRIVALSNSAHFDSRSQLIRAIVAAMEEALDQNTILIYPGKKEAPGSFITRKHAKLVRKFASRSVCTVPFCHDGSIFGLLTLESRENWTTESNRLRLCEQCAALITPFLALKKRDEAGLPAKIVDLIKPKIRQIIGPKNIGFKLTASCLGGLLVFSSMYETDFQIHADAVLEGEVQRIVAASLDGFVASSRFGAGDQVKAGDVLATLDDKDLQLELVKLASEHQKHEREHREAMAEENRVQVRISGALIAQTEAQMELVREQLSRTRILAPFDGVIIDGDLSQSLGSPVERGETLFKVAPLSGYRIMLKVDERDIAYVEKAQYGTLMLSSLPGKRLPLQIEKITAVAETEKGYNAFRVKASLRENDVELRPGMQGIGKIEVGKATMLWIWTHEMIDWLRIRLWSWLR